MLNKKIKNLKDISLISSKFKKKNKKVVLCHGVFDLMHSGHINHFNEAKNYGDILIVSLTKDEFIKKGVNRPIFKINDRLTCIASLEVVNYVVISPTESAENIIKLIKPNFYVKGPDYKDLTKDKTKKIRLEKKAVENNKGKIVFTKAPMQSSSKLLFQSEMIFSKDQKKFLNSVAKSIDLNQVEEILSKIKKLKVLVVGETIIDKYTFCETIGKASKDPMLVVKKKEDQIYLGGASSIVQNVKKLCDNVHFLSEIGSENTYKSFINKKLKNINKTILKNRKFPTIEKRRYIDQISNTKLLGLYNVEDSVYFKNKKNLINNFLKKKLKNFDVVIASDYGHGLLDNESSKLLVKNSNYLFLNCQINANNKGNHLILKYKGASNLIINESELRYEMRDDKSSVEKLLRKFSSIYKINLIIVTMGINGTILFDKKKNKILKIPAFASKVVDKVGTGDIMLAVLAPFFAVSKYYEAGILAGSMFASKSLKKFGNENILDAVELTKFFSTFLK